MLRKKKYFFLCLFFLFFFQPKTTYAVQNCCYGHGGDYSCNAQTLALYCRDGTVSTVCSCQAVSTPTPPPTPTNIPTSPTQTIPDCPSNAAYNADNTTCTCNQGYIVENNTCVTDSNYCWDKYGGNAEYDAGNQACTCSSGYIWNSSGTSCVSLNNYCQTQLGNNSYYDTNNNTCNCYGGYAIQNNQCVLTPTAPAPTPQNTDTSLPIETIAPIPIIPTDSVSLPTAIPTVTPTRSLSTPVSSQVKNLILQAKNYVTTNKPQQSVFAQIITNVWSFIRSIFGFGPAQKAKSNTSSSPHLFYSKYTLPSPSQNTTH